MIIRILLREQWENLARFLTAGVLCSNARLIAPDTGSPQWTILGDPTEAAILVAAAKTWDPL